VTALEVETLYAECHQRLRTVIRRHVPWHAVEDVEQRTWVKIIARREPWVLRFAYDEIRDWWREESRWRGNAEESFPLPNGIWNDAAVHEYRAIEAARTILSALDDSVVAVACSTVNGLSQHEAARNHDMTARTFRNRVRKYGEQLRLSVWRRRRGA
jgi:DNA-directed RNA polymerase specialized sigma24 family protein